MKSHLIIGRGQVGNALLEVLTEGYGSSAVAGIDVDTAILARFDVIHICFPYGPDFIEQVRKYQAQYLTVMGLPVIHSTVVLGTSRELDAVHSPIRGVHPNLAEGIRTFAKFFGGPRAEEAAAIFRPLGINCITTPQAATTEALKLWDTTQYGWNIILEKGIHAYCEKHGLDFDMVYRMANLTYNAGYRQLGKSSVVRPVLNHVPGPIGGHCVMPNAALLGDEIAQILLIKGAE